MIDKKYTLNQSSLEYNQVSVSWKKRIYSIVLYSLSIFVSSIIFISIYSLFFDTSKEDQLKKELGRLTENYTKINQRLNELSVVIGDMETRDQNIYRLVFEAEPINTDIQKHEPIFTNDIVDNKMALKTSIGIKKMKNKMLKLSDTYDKILELTLNKEKTLKYMPAIFPVNVGNFEIISAGYGYLMHPILKTVKLHKGIDFSGTIGDPIYATADGYVSRIRVSSYGMGTFVIITHGFGFKTIYAHCNKILVRDRQKVKRGQQIAEMGNTGQSVGIHLHYEIKKNGKNVNPKNYFFNDMNASDYSRFVKLTENIGQSMD